ncbi:MAG TPA: LAGLIDADG family homing endonuclease, partial [Candidatus Udaeobacter sp.]|nr:LAGLIDADG family homing endonuclease [Candidatus Udaeobacter sp.]
MQLAKDAYTRPQLSACFIQSIQDDLMDIAAAVQREMLLFKFGSGTGTNFSAIRGEGEKLSGGGTSSGLMSFLEILDRAAGATKSGGTTRRAAKMVILDMDHPDIVKFINWKAREEEKAGILIAAGLESDFNGEAYKTVSGQNSNNSVRMSDEFMHAVIEGREWITRWRTKDEIAHVYQAADLMQQVAQAAWRCADPGVQFDTTINRWHTCKETDRINGSNPCVTGDTLVATADGWQRIDSLVGKPARIIGADGQPHLVTRIFPTGRKPVFRLRTRAGYEVRITADHRVWVDGRGDVAVKELAIGDGLLLAGAGFGRRAVSERLGLAIGVAVGDGCLVRSHVGSRTQETIILTMAADEAPILDVIAGAVNEEKQLRRVAGIAGNPGPVQVSATNPSGSRLAFSSQPVVDLFKEFAVLDQGSAGKRFLPAMYELDRPSQAAILRGLFSADGTVVKSGEKSHYVGLDSTSLELLNQVQLLLLGFGIKSKVYRERRGGVTEAMLPDGHGALRSYPVQEMHSLRITR